MLEKEEEEEGGAAATRSAANRALKSGLCANEADDWNSRLGSALFDESKLTFQQADINTPGQEEQTQSCASAHIFFLLFCFFFVSFSSLGDPVEDRSF